MSTHSLLILIINEGTKICQKKLSFRLESCFWHRIKNILLPSLQSDDKQNYTIIHANVSKFFFSMLCMKLLIKFQSNIGITR